jgi:hypothetical protein
MVLAHSDTIEQLVDAAIRRKRIPRDNRNNRNNSPKAIAEARAEARAEAIASATLRAYELARETTEDFEHHLRFVLSRELRRGNARSTNPLDHVKVFLDHQAPKNKIKLHMDEPGEAGDEFIDEVTTDEVLGISHADADATSAIPPNATDKIGLPESLETRINRVLPKPYRAVARLRFVEHLPIKDIARKTRRTEHWLDRFIPWIEKRLNEAA